MIERHRKYFKTLNRRLSFLEQRLAADPGLSFDAAEAAALRFALECIERTFGQVKPEDQPQKGNRP